MLTTPIPTPLPGPSPRIRSWRVSRASHKAPRPPKPHNLCHEPLLQDTSHLRGTQLFAPLSGQTLIAAPQSRLPGRSSRTLWFLSSPWRNPFFLSDGSDNGDSGSFEMDEAAEAKNKGLCYRHIGERLSSQESAKINDESRFLSSRGVPAPSKERKIRLRLNAPM